MHTRLSCMHMCACKNSHITGAGTIFTPDTSLIIISMSFDLHSKAYSMFSGIHSVYTSYHINVSSVKSNLSGETTHGVKKN